MLHLNLFSPKLVLPIIILSLLINCSGSSAHNDPNSGKDLDEMTEKVLDQSPQPVSEPIKTLAGLGFSDTNILLTQIAFLGTSDSEDIIDKTWEYDALIGTASLNGLGIDLRAQTADWDYDYSRYATLNNNGKTEIGFFVMPTHHEDIPINGQVKYAGKVVGMARTQSHLADLSDGQLEISVNFDNPNGIKFDAYFSDQNEILDHVNIQNLTLTGNGFFGGTLLTYKNGQIVNLSTAQQTLKTQGYFLGPVLNGSGPAELAGTVLFSNDANLATLSLMFAGANEQ